MTGVSYVTNDKGEKTALLIDLIQLRKEDTAENDLDEFLEELDNIIVLELSRGQNGRPYEDVRKEILKR
jgi:hypothetical protein